MMPPPTLTAAFSPAHMAPSPATLRPSAPFQGIEGAAAARNLLTNTTHADPSAAPVAAAAAAAVAPLPVDADGGSDAHDDSDDGVETAHGSDASGPPMDEDVYEELPAALPTDDITTPPASPLEPCAKHRCFGVDEMVTGRRVRLPIIIRALKDLMPVEMSVIVWDMSEPVLPVWRIHGFSLGCMMDSPGGDGVRNICNIARPDTVALLQHLGSLLGQKPGAAGKGVLAIDYCDEIRPGLTAEVVKITSLESNCSRGGPPYNATLQPVATAVVTSVTQTFPEKKFPAVAFKILPPRKQKGRGCDDEEEEEMSDAATQHSNEDGDHDMDDMPPAYGADDDNDNDDAPLALPLPLPLAAPANGAWQLGPP